MRARGFLRDVSAYSLGQYLHALGTVVTTTAPWTGLIDNLVCRPFAGKIAIKLCGNDDIQVKTFSTNSSCADIACGTHFHINVDHGRSATHWVTAESTIAIDGTCMRYSA